MSETHPLTQLVGQELRQVKSDRCGYIFKFENGDKLRVNGDMDESFDVVNYPNE